MRGKVNLLYPIFLACTQFTNNSYWNTIYEELAYGCCPYGMYISNDCICCNYKNKKFSYRIRDDIEPLDLYRDLDKIFRKFGLISKGEKTKKNYKYDSNDWASIKKKNIKRTLIEKYVIENSIKNNLSPEKMQNLLDKIILGLLLKTLNTECIIYEDRNIKEISCISFKEEDFYVNLDLFSFKANVIII